MTISADIHDNTIGYNSLQSVNTAGNNGGVFIEESIEGPFYIRKNQFKNIGTPIQVYPDGGK